MQNTHKASFLSLFVHSPSVPLSLCQSSWCLKVQMWCLAGAVSGERESSGKWSCFESLSGIWFKCHSRCCRKILLLKRCHTAGKRGLGEFFDGVLIHQSTKIEDIYRHLAGMQLLNILAFWNCS